MSQTTIDFLADYRELFNPQWRYIVYYGGRNSGKSRQVGTALILRGRQQQLRVLCTREIQNTIKDSVHKLLKDIIAQYEFSDYVITNDSIINNLTGTEFIFRGIRHNTNEIKSTEGIDVCWIEEAQTITDASIDVITPTIRKAGSQIIYTFNRINELDPVYVRYVMNQPSNAYVKKVNYDVLERVGLLSDVIKQEIEQDRSDPPLFAHKWLGEPLGQTELAIISRQAVLAAMDRVVDDNNGADIVGVDVARMGNDRTVFWRRRGLKTISNKVLAKLRTTQVCDALEQFISFDKDVELRIDDTGVGGGVTDEMLRRQYNVLAINFGGAPADKDKYPNWISEAWFNMAGLMGQVELPMDSDLIMELSTRQWAQDAKGKRRVESKEHYKKRGFRSPDIADAVIICYGQPVIVNAFVRMSL